MLYEITKVENKCFLPIFTDLTHNERFQEPTYMLDFQEPNGFNMWCIRKNTIFTIEK